MDEPEEIEPDAGPDDFFAATPGLRWLLTAAGLLGMAVGGLDAAVNGASAPAGAAVGLSAGLVWTAWRERLPTRYRIGWLAWVVAAGAAAGWPGRPFWLVAGLAGVGLGALAPTVRAVRGPAPEDPRA